MSWILSHFVHPAMLGGLALIAAPIIIWLFSRLRFRVVEWAAQSFLLRAMKRSQRRLRIENLLLLLIRCLVIAFFVLALARPRMGTIVPTETTDARRNVVVLIDASYSTGYQVGSDAQQTVHEKEKRAARELIRQLRPVDRVALLAFDEQVRRVYATPRTVDARTQREILDELDNLPEVQRGARGTDYASVFHALPEVLRRFDAGPEGQPPPPDLPPSRKAVFLFTDCQRSGLLSGNALKDPTLRGVAEDVTKLGATVYVVDCGADEPKNAGIVLLEAREPIVGANLPCYVECTVKNFGALAPGKGAKGEALSGLTLEWFVDGGDSPVKSVSLDLQPEETKPIEPLRYVFHEKGPHRVIARLRSDALQIDNERALVIDVREAVEVLLVDGDPKPEKWESETDFLRKALDPFGDAAQGKDLIRPEVIPEAALPVGNLRKYDLVVLANVVSLSEDHVAALEQYVKEGGAVVFTMGNLVDRDHYNDRLWRRGAGLFPCELGDVKGAQLSERSGDRDPNASEWIFALAQPDHPVLRTFGEEDMRPFLRQPSVFRFFEAKNLTVMTEKGTPLQAQVPLKLVGRPRDEATPDKNADAAALRDGAPALVEKAFGRGRVAAFLTTADPAWTNAVVYDVFYVVFWRQLALDFARTSRPKKNLGVGDRYERIIGTGEYAPSVEVFTPDGGKETFRPEAIEGREQFRIAYPPSADTRVDKDSKHDDAGGADRPGLYEVRLTGGAGDSAPPPPPDYFAVRLDASEGDVAKLDVEDWKEQLPGLDVRRGSAEAPAEVFQGVVTGQQSDERWPLAIATCIVLLALESFLAALFGRRRQ